MPNRLTSIIVVWKDKKGIPKSLIHTNSIEQVFRGCLVIQLLAEYRIDELKDLEILVVPVGDDVSYSIIIEKYYHNHEIVLPHLRITALELLGLINK